MSFLHLGLGFRVKVAATVDAFSHFAARDPLSDAVLERMLAGVSTRRFGRTSEPVGEEVRA